MARVYQITEEALRQFWPRASDAVIAGTLKAWPDVAAHYGFNSVNRCAFFWGEITWECSGGTELRENMSYSAGRILEVFGAEPRHENGAPHHSAEVTAAEAKDLAHHPYALAERVYGLGNPKKAKELGNTQPGDGYYFRGFDALNSTGREAADKIGRAIGQDLVSNSDLCNDPGIALWAAAEEYVNSLGCFRFADRGDVEGDRKRVNGGTNGMGDVTALIGRWKSYFTKADAVDVAAPASDLPAKSEPAPVLISPKSAPAITPFALGIKTLPLSTKGAFVVGVVSVGAWIAQHTEYLEIGVAGAIALGLAYFFIHSRRAA